MGSSWRTSFDNPSGRTSYCEPASKGNLSTIAIASEQCQTSRCVKKLDFHEFFPGLHSCRKLDSSVTLPAHGLPLDALALCLHQHGRQVRRVHLLRRDQG